MKKLVLFRVIVVAMLAFVSCSSGGSTPADALKNYATALQDGKYEKFVDGINFSNATPDQQKEAREGFVALVKEKGAKEFEKKGGFKGFEILSEEIAEDGNSAVVKFKQIYGNGEEEESEQKMVKVDGKWLMDIGK